MPTLPAAGYAVPTAPSIGPSPDAGTPYQSAAGATPEAFGGGTAAAISRFGASAGQASDILERHNIELRDLKNRDEANSMSLKAASDAGQVIAEYEAKTGREAADAYPQYQKTLVDLRNQYKAQMSNPLSARMFDSDFSNQVERALYYGARHAASEQRKAFVDTNKAVQAQTIGNIATNSNDDVAFEQGLAKLKDKAIEETRMLGGHGPDDPVTLQHIDKVTSEAYLARIDEFAKTDPLRASRFYTAHNGEIRDPAARMKIEQRIGQGMLNQGVKSDADAILRPSGGPAVERFLDLAEAKESGGRNIEQQVVGPDGGYNPSTGTVTGPSSASGNFQIIDPTWKAFAPKAGVDLNQYPRAISAPYDVQRQVARTIATTSGVQHWTDYNKNLAAAAKAEGLPLSGPIQGGAAGSAPAAQSLEQMHQAADARVEALAKQGVIGDATGTPVTVYRDMLHKQIDSAYHTSDRAARQLKATNYHAAAAGANTLTESGEPVYKDLDSYLQDDGNRQAYEGLDEPDKTRIRSRLAKNSQIIPMNDTRLQALFSLKAEATAQPDQFVAHKFEGMDFPANVIGELNNMKLQIEKESQSPTAERSDLSFAKGVIRGQGLLANQGIDLNSKDDARAHQFVYALNESLKQFRQEKKRAMTSDEVRKLVPQLMATTDKGWLGGWAFGIGKQSAYQQFVPKAFGESYRKAFRDEHGAEPTPEQMIDAFHKSQGPPPAAEAPIEPQAEAP